MVCIIGGIGPFTFFKGIFKNKPEPHIVNYPILSSSTYEEKENANDDIDGYNDKPTHTSVSSEQNPSTRDIVYPNEQSYTGNYNYYNDQTSSATTTSYTQSQNTTNNDVHSQPRKQCMPLYANDMAHCGGTGKCQRCGGDGLVDDMFGGGPNSLECSSCRHSGKCSSCNGSGFLN